MNLHAYAGWSVRTHSHQCHRSYWSSDDMNDIFIENWNNTVNPADEAYILRGFTMDCLWKALVEHFKGKMANGFQIRVNASVAILNRRSWE